MARGERARGRPSRNGSPRLNKKPAAGKAGERGITEEEADVVEERHRLRAPVIYEIVRAEGDEELERPLTSLWWSGIAAGLAMGFSLVAQAALYYRLPDEPWRPLVSGFGYTVGFIIVILARQQLFTENTITPILPLAADFKRRTLWCVARMWGVVFLANMVGAFAFALFNTILPGVEPQLHDAMMTLSSEALADNWTDMLIGAIGAGFLIATIVWIIPSAESAKLLVIIVFTYLIEIAGFHHIVAGSIDAFLLMLAGQISIAGAIGGFIVPVFIGNVIGGTALFTLLSYAQVMREIEE